MHNVKQTDDSVKQGNYWLHFARGVHSHHPVPDDRRCGLSSTCGGLSHEHRQYAKKIVKIARVVP